MIFSGESDSPDVIRDTVSDEIDRITKEGIDEELFGRIKKSAYGSLIRELNNVEAVANLMMNSHMDGVGPYDTIEVLSKLKSSDVLDFMKNELIKDRCVMSVIERTV